MKPRSRLTAFVQRACELGAVGAKAIRADSIVTASWVRLKCQFGCGGWGSSLCCPPHTPSPEETATMIVAALEREIFLAGHYKALGFGSGPCRLCRECSFAGCSRPEDARPSMEACGIDVFATARANGFPIDVVRDEGDERNHYGLVLVE
jgi:predicted metal-binding protein